MAYLEGLSAVDLGIFIAGEDFAATQSMTEEFRQTVTFRGAFGSDGPVLRSIRASDEDEVTFEAVLLKKGVARGMNDEAQLKKLRDFEVVVRRGTQRRVYPGCNWTMIRVSSTLDEVTLSANISIPGYGR